MAHGGGSACRAIVKALGYCLVVTLMLPTPASAVHWHLENGREECVSAYVPKDQWDLIMQSVVQAGELPTVNVTTAEMDVHIEAGVLIYDRQRLQDPRAAVDMCIIDPHGKELRYRIHTNDDESSSQARGPRGPWKLCLQVARTGTWYKTVIAQITHFNINHRELMGTHLEEPKTTMPNISLAVQSAAVGSGVSPDVASPLHLAEAQLALQDVDMYLRGTHFEASHRLAVVQAAMRDARRQAARLVRWMLAINTAVIGVCVFQVLAIRWMFRHNGAEPSIYNAAGSGVNMRLHALGQSQSAMFHRQHR